MSVGSAHWIAAARARESTREDRLFDDPYAHRLAGDTGYLTMARSEQVGGGENRFLPVRTRWCDDVVLAEVAAGVAQVALLGAGLDTRPFRLPLPADVEWFELDRPELFATKEPMLTGEPVHCRRHVVPVDLAGEWLAPLREAGFDDTRRTLWVAEGLFFYLDQPEIVALLRTAATASVAGGTLIGDVFGSVGLDGPALDAYRSLRRRLDQPPPYGTDDPAGLLRAGGWRLSRACVPGAAEANFGRLPPQPPGLHPGLPHLIVAEIGVREAGQRDPLPHPERH